MAADPIIDGFQALGELSDDAPFAERLRMRADEVLVGQESRKDALLAGIYLRAEDDLVRRGMNQEEVRRRAGPIFEKSRDYPGFTLLFAAPEKQFIALGSELMAAHARHARQFLGGPILQNLARTSLRDTPWKEIGVSLEKGIEYHPIRMRSVGECGEILSALFERWYQRESVVLGARVEYKLFERAYRDVEQTHGFLPMMKNLLGVTPREVLSAEKARRLHDLESETLTQARGLRAADEGLHRQAERLRQTVAELEATKASLEVAAKARSEFIDVVAHQFRTPLSSIRWNAELLTDAFEENKIDPQYRDAIENIRSRSVYLIETLERVFAALDIETGAVVLDRKPAFLWEVVQDVYKEYEKDIKRRGMKWQFKRDKDQVREVPMDKAKISAVLKIIIGNAVAYNKDGGKITVDVRQEKINGADYQICSVSDEGIGIPKADAERIFEKFYRTKQALLKAADGTGLGLFIIKNYIELHNGQVWVESAGEEKGTTFAFALPVK